MDSAPALKTLVAYIPAPHSGYVELFHTYAGGELWILGEDFISEHKSLVRHLPGLKPQTAAAMIRALYLFERVEVLTRENFHTLAARRIAMPDEDIARLFAKMYFSDREVEFDSGWKLRWDWTTTTHKKNPEEGVVVSREGLDRELMRRAYALAKRSPDWWRQIGALLCRDGKPLLVAFNTHLPLEQTAYVLGDPRSNFEPGQHIDATLSLHGENGLISAAAKRGISTDGCDLYCTTFPCPPCAAAIANAGIRRLFYAEGYSLVAGADTLRSRNVEIVRVELHDALVSS